VERNLRRAVRFFGFTASFCNRHMNLTAHARSGPCPQPTILPEVLQTTEAERLATGFIFTEGPLWHPEGYWYFVDLRQNKLFRVTPGHMVGHRGDDGRA